MLKREYILPVVIVLFLALQKGGAAASGQEKSYLGRAGLPRGVRNNNPGNLKYTDIQWRGKIPYERNTDPVYPDGKHEQFENWYYGVRAMVKDITGDIQNKGQDTIRKLISAYAVGSRDNYVNYVSGRIGKGADQLLVVERDIYPLIDAMSRWENGLDYGEVISRADYEKARAI